MSSNILLSRRYQVFISSTFLDLEHARKEVSHALLRTNCFPSGMELFPPANEEQFEFIKEKIDESDYYLVISAGRYGSVHPVTNVGFTEMEYDYAVSIGKPIIRLLHRDPLKSLPGSLMEETDIGKKRLLSFRNKLKENRLVNFWGNTDELGKQVVFGLLDAIHRYPSQGWVAGNAMHLSSGDDHRNIVKTFKDFSDFSDEGYHKFPIPLLRLKKNGLIEFGNKAAIEAMAETKIIGKSIHSLLRPTEGYLDVDPKDFDSDARINKQVATFVSSNGEKHFDLLFSEVVSEGKDTILAVINDITALKNSESMQFQAEKMRSLGQLAAGVAHDFNNLLTSIRLDCDEAINQIDVDEQGYDAIEQISSVTDRAAGLVRKLLAFSRKQTLRPETIDLNTLLDDVVVLLKQVVTEKCELILVKSASPLFVRVDRTSFETAIINLVVNARDAMPSGGKITLNSGTKSVLKDQVIGNTKVPAALYCSITVSDEGRGVPPEIKDRIFEPFFSTKEAGPGTGLGLATVVGVVNQSDGFVYFENLSRSGAEFTILLPFRSSKENSVSAAPMIQKPIDLKRVIRFLVVDDEETIRSIIGRVLRLRGMEVIECSTGEEALKLLNSQESLKVDLIVTDVVLPGLNGPDWVKKAIEDYHVKAPVVFISGYAPRETEKLASRMKNTSFLPKPFSISDLLGHINKSLDGEFGQNEQ